MFKIVVSVIQQREQYKLDNAFMKTQLRNFDPTLK